MGRFSARFSPLEIKHLIVSVLVMSFILAFDRSLNVLHIASLMPIMLIVIAPAFVLHEIAHKIVAQNHGFWAEYRMWGQGLLFALILKVLFGVAFIAPGAVYFSSGGLVASRADVGRIGIAGVIVNLFLAVIFGLIGLLSSNPVLSLIGGWGAYVNSFLAMFNLIPFPPFDGQKVFAWDKRIWLFAMVLAITLFIVAGSSF